MYNRLVGKGNESDIIIEGSHTRGLIDTGSMISSISEAFLSTLDPVPEIHTLDELGLEVNTANGQSLPYSGYVEIELSVPCFKEKAITVPLLVVPVTEYNSQVPVIVGTNIIRQYKNSSEGL